MSIITLKAISASSDDELVKLLGKELGRRIAAKHSSSVFVFEIQKLPVGLRAMAATYELDVSLTLDDLGWHFGNWHSLTMAEETIRGLEELGASELANVFREALRLAVRYWPMLGSKDWSRWYQGSPLEKAMELLNQQAWSILKRNKNRIFYYWADYARKHPDRIGITSAYTAPEPTALSVEG